MWLAGKRSVNYLMKTSMNPTTFRPLHSTIVSNGNSVAGEGSIKRSHSTMFPCRGSSSTFIFKSYGFEYSTTASNLLDRLSSNNEFEAVNQDINFPGGPVPFTHEMRFLPESSETRVPCYRVLDEDGYPFSSSQFPKLDKEIAVKMYSGMVTFQVMDTIVYEAQRQGRISFYMTSFGEEAINLGSAAAISSDDMIMPQYREPGAAWWRGFTIQDFVNQFFGNKNDYGKGRQMPTHIGSKKHNCITISATLATQLPQAVGVAYSLKMDKKDACVVTYLGDGSSSEGDFHASLNFAAVMEVPVVYICRNNGWAISTPVTEQFRSDGIVVKGKGYGIRSIRVDGNDVLAVYDAVRAAREMAINEQRPILIEALTYRVGHHSTSDDSTKYRSVEEIELWKNSRNPVTLFKKWIQREGWWSDIEESEFRRNVRKQVIHAIQVAEKTEKPPVGDIFSDVYDELPLNLTEQESLLKEAITKHPQDYPKDVPL
ncbi:2-oxoisovalerate dehydrogenase subunit alpha 2, mitochondrial-like [Rutidosis leptorrhynchoides]|uniref:2-oxoisovalerate dehydrogenase subunit alpha 2, mitochondrial-like n=1 Tax=Rutidosis leptorrhynchoides TaxID=125765 RepID=UPI003A9A603D